MFHSSDKNNRLFFLSEYRKEADSDNENVWIGVGREDSESSVPRFSPLQVEDISKPKVDIWMNLTFCLPFLCGQSPVQWRWSGISLSLF